MNTTHSAFRAYTLTGLRAFQKMMVTSFVLLLVACGGGGGGSDPDTDRDGVADGGDSCVNTPENLIASVNTNGCHDDEITDGDSDNVMNVADMCPSTPVALVNAVDGQGCHSDEITDGDGDGVMNLADLCSATPPVLAGAVNADGCHSDEITDGDGDGVMNLADLCSATPPVLAGAVNADGCHTDELTDTDIDSVVDSVDTCPNTPTALVGAVAANGCHIDEISDSDNDGVMNAVDDCAATPEGLAVDKTGCDEGTESTFLLSVKAINAGYLDYLTADGTHFERDQYFTWSKEVLGAVIRSGNNITGERDVLNTEDDDLYRYHRLLDTGSNINYQIPLPNGDYIVRLYLAEMNLGNVAGSRIFDVQAEGDEIFTDIDIVAAVGAVETAYTPISEEFSVSDGTLNLSFVHQTGGPIVSGIEILQILEREEDEDGDSVWNVDDKCVYTPDEFVGSINDATGCAAEELDSDNDGVLDPADHCPNTPNLDGIPATDQVIDSDGCSLADLDSDNDLVSDDRDLCDNTRPEDIDSVNANGCTTTESALLAQPFVEENGIVIVEMESTNYSSNWHLHHGKFASGNSYLEWRGGWNPNPSTGSISIDVQINNPGIYRFLWRNGIGEDVRPTEFNDSWAKISSEIETITFYGLSSKGNGTVICPPVQESTNDCVQTGHRENNQGGTFFKVFRNQRPTFDWSWTTFYNGADTHAVYAKFNVAGTYQVVIDGRSNFHLIDRFVLYRDDTLNNDAPMVSQDAATDINLPESGHVPL